MNDHEEIAFEDVVIIVNHGRTDSVCVDGWAFGLENGAPTLGTGYTALLKIPEDDYVKIPGTKRHDQSLILLAFEIARESWKRWQLQCKATWHEPVVRAAHTQFFPCETIPGQCPRCGSTRNAS